MIMELLIQGIIRYRDFISMGFPYFVLALAVTNDEKIKTLFFTLVITSIAFQFIPTLDSIREAQAVTRMTEIRESKDIVEMCQSSIVRNKHRVAK